MNDQEIGQFSSYLADMLDLDANARQKLVSAMPEFLTELRRDSLEDAKAALRQVLKGKVPYGPGRIVGAVLGVLQQQHNEEKATKSRANEYLYEPGEVYRQETIMRNEAKPQWDALSESARQKRLEKAGSELGYTWELGRWRAGNGITIPNSWVEKRALTTFAEELELEVRT